MLTGSTSPEAATVVEPLTPDRRRQQTRDYLIRAAAQVFAERGFQGASLDEVAAVAGFTKGAVYSNFKSKDDLLLALLESLYERELAAVRATLESSGDPPDMQLGDFVALLQAQVRGENWAVLFQEMCLYAMRNPAARAKLAQFDDLDVESVADIIRAERERHSIESGEPPTHAARIVVALTRGIGIMRAVNPDAVDEAFLQSVLAFLARALMSVPDRTDTSPSTKRAPAKNRKAARSSARPRPRT